MARWRAARSAVGALLLALTACSGVPPLRHRLDAGKDPYIVFVADAPDGRGDLYAMAPAGGEAVQVTFTLPAEDGAALSPEGGMIAFLRARAQGDAAGRSVTVVNLLNGAERKLPFGDSLGAVRRLAWARDGAWVYARTDDALWRLPAPPREGEPERVPDAERAAADSLFGTFLGDPPFARIDACADDPAALCTIADTTSRPLAAGATEAFRWTGDSVAYLVGNELRVRPLGPGRQRTVRLPSRLARPRSFSYFAGGPRDDAPPGSR